MTRKHYEAIAQALAQGLEPVALTNLLADIFEQDNPRFNRERFLATVYKSASNN